MITVKSTSLKIALDNADKYSGSITGCWKADGLWHVAKTVTVALPYPWCFTPEVCGRDGRCHRDPNCGE